jgi:hypothetical protein
VAWLDSPVHLAVELTPTSWSFVAAKHERQAHPQLIAAEALTDGSPTLQNDIRQFRLRHHLPFDASFIVWPGRADRGVADLDVASPSRAVLGLPKAVVIRQRVAPFVRGGGRVRELLLPHEAVGRAVQLAGWPVACVLVLHPGAACLAIADAGILRGSYVAWQPLLPVEDDTARLLARYQLAARLVPHLRRWASEAPAARIAVCGSFPDLRSVMVPVVEELDREIDVLDASLVGRPGDEASDPDDVSRRQLGWAVAASER